VSECAEPRDGETGHSISECASASIEARTPHTQEGAETTNPTPHTRQVRSVGMLPEEPEHD
jgi:hypothetical protein